MTNCTHRQDPTYTEAGTTQAVERKPCVQCEIDHNANAVRKLVRNMNTSVDVKV